MIQGKRFISQPLSADTLSAADMGLILASHDCVDYQLLEQALPLIVDTRNAMKHSSPKIVRL